MSELLGLYDNDDDDDKYDYADEGEGTRDGEAEGEGIIVFIITCSVAPPRSPGSYSRIQSIITNTICPRTRPLFGSVDTPPCCAVPAPPTSDDQDRAGFQKSLAISLRRNLHHPEALAC